MHNGSDSLEYIRLRHSNPRKEIGQGRRVYAANPLVSPELSKEDVKALRKYVVIIEGGISQGKSALAVAMGRKIRSFGIPAHCCPEPTDAEALVEFMKYQKPLPSDATEAERLQFEDGRRAAAVRMQFSMMERRTKIVEDATVFAEFGVPIIDRGPFGDTTFMTATFHKYGVSTDHENKYIITFLKHYLDIHFPQGKFLLLRLDAPVRVTHPRYLEREKEVAGNKYTPEYLQSIETAHDSCAAAWGPYVVYDNSEVPYIRSMSPIDGDGNPTHGHPDDKAVTAVIYELCQLAKELSSEREAEIDSHAKRVYDVKAEYETSLALGNVDA